MDYRISGSAVSHFDNAIIQLIDELGVNFLFFSTVFYYR